MRSHVFQLLHMGTTLILIYLIEHFLEDLMHSQSLLSFKFWSGRYRFYVLAITVKRAVIS